MIQKNYFNIPNLLSISRIIFLPLLFIFLINNQTIEFIVGYILIGLTDLFDGMIARKYNLQSEFGMYLDTYADLCYYLSSAYFLYKLCPSYIEPNLIYLYFTLIVFAVVILISIIKFRKLLLLHTLISKACGVLVFLLVILSTFMDTTYLITIIITIYLISFIEEGIIFVKIGEVDGNTKSYFTAKPIEK